MGTTYYAATAEQSDVAIELAKSGPGDTVVAPDGDVTWGAGSSFLSVPQYVTLAAQGENTNISVAADAPGDAGVIRIGTGSVVAGLKLTGPETTGRGVVGVANGATNWRVTGLSWTAPVNSRFVYVGGGGHGLIDNCIVYSGSPSAELIYTKGYAGAWNEAATYGTSQAVYIEDCTFSGGGYVCDFNANAKGVVRNCTIYDSIKVDLHGVASNSGPVRGGRHMEVYNCSWPTPGNAPAIEHRGGGIMAFKNSNGSSGTSGFLRLHEYGLNPSTWGAFETYQTLNDYPIRDQVGRGRYTTPDDWTTAESEPAYLWLNRRPSDAPWNLSFSSIPNNNASRETDGEDYSIGATQIRVAGNSKFGTGTSFLVSGDSTRYVCTAGRPSGSPSTLVTIEPPLVQAISGVATLTVGSQQNYKYQQGDEGASFTTSQVIAADRDYFNEAPEFDGSTGVGVGTRSEMDAIMPTKTGVGFWVTDEGSWDSTLPENTSGQLYVWRGSSWELYYTPYAYPHPLRTGIDPDPPGPTPWAFPVRRAGFGFGFGFLY